MERVNLVRNERTRELSDMNHSLYEFLLPEEARPVEDRVVSHTIIKADVRGSTKITQDLLARGLNPASLFSLNFYEPVKRILERYGAAKVFIEGDALVLAIFETESAARSSAPYRKACAGAADPGGFRRLQRTVGNERSAPAGTGCRDRVSGFSADLLDGHRLAHHDLPRAEPFRPAFELLESRQAHALAEYFAISTVPVPNHGGGRGGRRGRRIPDSLQFERRGIERRGFSEITGRNRPGTPLEADCVTLGKERVTFFHGETPVGESLEPVLIRRGFIRQMLPGGRIGEAGSRPYYEVCVNPKVLNSSNTFRGNGRGSARLKRCAGHGSFMSGKQNQNQAEKNLPPETRRAVAPASWRGPPPAARVIPDKRLKPLKHKKQLVED